MIWAAWPCPLLSPPQTSSFSVGLTGYLLKVVPTIPFSYVFLLKSPFYRSPCLTSSFLFPMNSSVYKLKYYLLRNIFLTMEGKMFLPLKVSLFFCYPYFPQGISSTIYVCTYVLSCKFHGFCMSHPLPQAQHLDMYLPCNELSFSVNNFQMGK